MFFASALSFTFTGPVAFKSSDPPRCLLRVRRGRRVQGFEVYPKHRRDRRAVLVSPNPRRPGCGGQGFEGCDEIVLKLGPSPLAPLECANFRSQLSSLQNAFRKSVPTVHVTYFSNRMTASVAAAPSLVPAPRGLSGASSRSSRFAKTRTMYRSVVTRAADGVPTIFGSPGSRTQIVEVRIAFPNPKIVSPDNTDTFL